MRIGSIKHVPTTFLAATEVRDVSKHIRTLKFIQRLLHESLSRLIRTLQHDRSIVTNAKCHLGRRYVLNIADFFPKHESGFTRIG